MLAPITRSSKYECKNIDSQTYVWYKGQVMKRKEGGQS